MDVSRPSSGHNGLPKSDITRPSRKAIQESLPPLPDPTQKSAEDDAKRVREKKTPEEIREARQKYNAERKASLDKRRKAQRKKHTAARHANDETRMAKLEEKRANRSQGNHAGATAAKGATTAKGAASGPDRVQISATGRMVRGEVDRSESEARAENERAARVADLKEQFVQDRLNTPERISRAASRMLGESQ